MTNWHAEEYHWEPYWREGHRTIYGWAPALMYGPGAPGGATHVLPIGFNSEEACQEFIDQVLK